MVTWRALAFCLFALPRGRALGGCRTPAGDHGDAHASPDLAPSPVGPCYEVARKANLGCYGLGSCGTFQRCQLGRCCSGVIDPKTCICHCNGGPPCDEWKGDLCCDGLAKKRLPRPPDLGVLKCRAQDECSDAVGP